MRSVLPELTAQEAIRRVAMDLFAERGADRVTIRDLAAAAGVSPALVIHHYGSKDGLKRAVDERVIELMEQLIAEVAGSLGEGTATSMTELLSSGLDAEPHLLDYLQRILIDGGATADLVFRRLFEVTREAMSNLDGLGALRPAVDPAVRDAFLLVNDLAMILLRDQVAAVLGTDPLEGEGLATWSAQALDVYTHGIMADPADGGGAP